MVENSKISGIYKAFPTEESCLRHLEKLLWDEIPVSPFNVGSKVYRCKNGQYKCRLSGKYFSVKTNTIFHNTKIPLQKWFAAIEILLTADRKITSVELADMLGLTQKSAWTMMDRIKKHFGITNRRRFTKSPKEDTGDLDKLQMSEWLNLMKR
jgi:hypothetical protein